MEIIAYNFNNQDQDIFCLNLAKVNLTIGYFDGFHNGHLKILKKLQSRSKVAVVISFNKKINPKQAWTLMPNEFKWSVLEKKFQPDYVIETKVDNNLLDIDKNQFIFWLKNNFHINKIVVGSDFRFGKRAEGGVFDLKTAFGKRIKVIKRTNLSSTSLKDSLEKKDIYNFLRLSKKLIFFLDNSEIIFPQISIPDGVYLSQQGKKITVKNQRVLNNVENSNIIVIIKKLF